MVLVSLKALALSTYIRVIKKWPQNMLSFVYTIFIQLNQWKYMLLSFISEFQR